MNPMTKAVALATLSALLLAGCGVTSASPTTTGLSAKRAPVTAKAANDRRVELRVPARLLSYAEAHLTQLRAEHEAEYEKDMYGRPMYPKYRVVPGKVAVVASRDGFKTILSENTYNAGRRQVGRDMTVPFLAPVGPVTYYLAVNASLVSTATNKPVKQLPVHYISDHGANYQGQLEVERL
jgi:hypothetical protein